MSYQAYKEEAIGHLYKALYTKKERTTLLNEGFRGHPSIGAAVIAKKINLSDGNYTIEGEVWSWLKNRVNEDVKTGLTARIFLVGSIFGGTGAAGLPTVAKLLRHTFESFCESKKVVIGGGMGGTRIPAATEGGGAVAAMADGTVLAGGSELPTWLQQQQQVTPEMEEATGNYVDELKKLTEMLGKVADQSERLTRDSEEMENLNRTLTGISKVYEMQLKSASAQMGTIDQINEQSRKMAEQIAELNRIYARMIEAMTVNMKMKETL